jgi:hypothetical protein
MAAWFGKRRSATGENVGDRPVRNTSMVSMADQVVGPACGESRLAVILEFQPLHLTLAAVGPFSHMDFTATTVSRTDDTMPQKTSADRSAKPRNRLKIGCLTVSGIVRQALD